MIGVFDSGLGGLSVLAAIARALPRADLTYLADTAHVPYGDKPDGFIRGRVLAIGRHLVERGCTLAAATAVTGGASERNLVRHGFEPRFVIETWSLAGAGAPPSVASPA